jgi:hypothetical protein
MKFYVLEILSYEHSINKFIHFWVAWNWLGGSHYWDEIHHSAQNCPDNHGKSQRATYFIPKD